jgi:glycosyltransferase involved in cell wall biosynthesis
VAEIMRDHCPGKPIRVIPFLTSEQPNPRPAERPCIGSRLMRVTYLGRLVEQKRPDQLAKRWKKLCSEPGFGPARLDIYGYDPTGEMLQSLGEFVASEGLGEVVQVHGQYDLSELPAILKRSDLVVLPSLWEGLPLVLVEAMLHGVPFVATAAGGTEELGKDNPDVRITSTEWSDFEHGLTETVQKLRSEGINSVRLHQWAEERYGCESVCQKWLECLLQPRKFFGVND